MNTPRRTPYRFTEPGRCRWCGESVRPPRRSWCSDGCVSEYQALQPDALRRAVFERDRGICALCGRDCQALETRINERLRGLVGGNTRQLELRARGRWHRMFQRLGVPVLSFHRLARSLWDADHTVPLVEGGANTVENMRTLCLPCHKRQTRALAGRRAAARTP